MNDNGSPNGTTVREAFESMLAKGTVGVAVIAGPGLVLPDDVALPCRLDYGYQQRRPPVDLTVTDEGISAGLSFAFEVRPTFVPWSCVTGLVLVAPNPSEPTKTKLRSV